MIQGYDKAIQLDPNAMAYIVRGVSYAKLGQHQNTIADYTKAIRIGGSCDAMAYHNRGILGSHEFRVITSIWEIQGWSRHSRGRSRLVKDSWI